MFFQTTTALLLAGLASAIPAPGKNGFNIVWQDDFAGAAGSPVNTGVWNIAEAIDTNNEVQTYTGYNSNLQISGGGTVQFVPRKSPSGHWTSARIETKGSWFANPGQVMIVEGSLRVGNNAVANKQGIWPAFWMLGDSMRHGTDWPRCGELDIFEQISGTPTAHGTVHCDVTPGGHCNEGTGRQGSIDGLDNDWHRWSIKIDRTAADWTQETITWFRDDTVFQVLSGATIGDLGVWATLAHSPFYVLMNVAVGGNWPGAPNDATADGYEAGMEVQYVAVYLS